MRKLSVALAALALLVPVPSASATTATVVVQDMAFGTPNVTVPIGGSVTWSFRDMVAHTSTSDQRFWDSGQRQAGQSYTVAFPSAGVFAYHCTNHPTTMRGTITARVALAVTSGGHVIIWSTATGGPHRVFDVQWRRTGSSTWVTMARRTTAARRLFSLSLRGSFVVRARTVNPVTGATAGWTGRAFTQ